MSNNVDNEHKIKVVTFHGSWIRGSVSSKETKCGDIWFHLWYNYKTKSRSVTHYQTGDCGHHTNHLLYKHSMYWKETGDDSFLENVIRGFGELTTVEDKNEDYFEMMRSGREAKTGILRELYG